MTPNRVPRRDKVRILLAFAALWAVVGVAGLGPRGVEPAIEAELLPGVTATGVVVWDPERDDTLMGVDAHVAKPMASTTKLMTALVAAEGLDSADETATVPPEAPRTVEGNAGVHAGLRAGDQIPVIDLLAAAVLESANDAAATLAIHIAGSEPAFVAEMNARADQLGLDDTHFTDSTGLANGPANLSSPADLVRLLDAAQAEPRLAELLGATTHTTTTLGTLTHRSALLQQGAVTAAKTGYTSQAGQTLATTIEHDGTPLHLAILGSDNRAHDARLLLDHLEQEP